MISEANFQKKILLFLLLLMSNFLSAQEIAETSICSQISHNTKVERSYTTPPSFLFLNVDFDKKNHLLTIHTRDKLKNATITILTSKDEIVYQESAIKIDNNYLLSIEENSPKGVYHIYVEEKNEGIWIERFIK